jgi:hypothetical protein
LLGQAQHGRGQRGGEEQMLAARGHELEYASELIGEAERKEPIGLVQHEHL